MMTHWPFQIVAGPGDDDSLAFSSFQPNCTGGGGGGVGGGGGEVGGGSEVGGTLSLTARPREGMKEVWLVW